MLLKEKKQKVHPFAAGVVGVVIGAVGATAVALSDKAIRKKAQEKIKQTSAQVTTWGKHAKKKMRESAMQMQKKLSEHTPPPSKN